METNVEIWKGLKLPGVKSGMYMVSNKGNIFSKYSMKILRPIKKHNGYYRVNLSLTDGGQREFSIHRIVALHFLDTPNGENPEKYQVNHKNGNKKENNVSNLEWCTAKENIRHSIDTGLHIIKYANTSNNHKFTEDDVRRVCEALELEYRGKRLLRFLNVDSSWTNFVRRVRERRHWTTISKDYIF